MIVNSTSKVYGPSTNNFYEAEAVLVLMNLLLLGFQDFFGRMKKAMVNINSVLDS